MVTCVVTNITYIYTFATQVEFPKTTSTRTVDCKCLPKLQLQESEWVPRNKNSYISYDSWHKIGLALLQEIVIKITSTTYKQIKTCPL